MFRYLTITILLLTALGCASPAPQDDGPKGPGGPGTSAASNSQQPPGAPPGNMDAAQRLERLMQDLTKRLKLTPEQAKQVKAIIKAGEDKKASMKPKDEQFNSPSAMEKFLIRLNRVDKETEQALSKVLSASQMDAYRKYIKEQRSLHGKGLHQGGSPGGGPPPGGGM